MTNRRSAPERLIGVGASNTGGAFGAIGPRLSFHDAVMDALDVVFELSPLQMAVFDMSCDLAAYDETGLAALCHNIRRMSSADCRSLLSWQRRNNMAYCDDRR